MGAKKVEVEATELRGEMRVDKMIERQENKYLLVNLLAQRAREINEGSKPRVELEPPFTPIEAAIGEGDAGKLEVIRRNQEKDAVDLVDKN